MNIAELRAALLPMRKRGGGVGLGKQRTTCRSCGGALSKDNRVGVVLQLRASARSKPQAIASSYTSVCANCAGRAFRHFVANLRDGQL